MSGSTAATSPLEVGSAVASASRRGSGPYGSSYPSAVASVSITPCTASVLSPWRSVATATRWSTNVARTRSTRLPVATFRMRTSSFWAMLRASLSELSASAAPKLSRSAVTAATISRSGTPPQVSSAKRRSNSTSSGSVRSLPSRASVRSRISRRCFGSPIRLKANGCRGLRICSGLAASPLRNVSAHQPTPIVAWRSRSSTRNGRAGPVRVTSQMRWSTSRRNHVLRSEALAEA